MEKILGTETGTSDVQKLRGTRFAVPSVQPLKLKRTPPPATVSGFTRVPLLYCIGLLHRAGPSYCTVHNFTARMSQEGRLKWITVLILFVLVNILLLWRVVAHQWNSRTDVSLPQVQSGELSLVRQGVTGAIYSRKLSFAVVQKSRPITGSEAKPTTSRTITPQAVQHDHGYLLELHVSDQLTGGVVNVMSIQCMASKLSPKLIVVEPFVMNSSYGAVLEVEDRESFDRENNVKLRDIYDIDVWNKMSDYYHYNRLAPWESFIDDAPRDLILVENQWGRDCNLPLLTKKFLGFFKTFKFRVARTVCLDFKKSGAMNAGMFKSVVYGEYAPEQVTVIIDLLPGIGTVSRWSTAVERKSCRKMKFWNVIFDNLPSAKRIKHDAEEYIKRYLGGKKDFVSLMIRLEHSYMAATQSKIEQIKLVLQESHRKWTAVNSRQKLGATFLAFDVGKYGSAEFYLGNRGPMGEILAEMHRFFDSLYNGSISYSEWEDSFVEVSGVKSGTGVSGYVAILQKEIASQGQCIILIGGGSFQKSAGHLHQLAHPGHTQC